MDENPAKAMLGIGAGQIGRDMAYHLVLERLLVLLFEGDPDGFEAFAAECLSAMDVTLEMPMGDTAHLSAHHTMATLEALFGGARSLLPSSDDTQG